MAFKHLTSDPPEAFLCFEKCQGASGRAHRLISSATGGSTRIRYALPHFDALDCSNVCFPHSAGLVCFFAIFHHGTTLWKGHLRRPRIGVRCERMSLKLLTGQSRLVEALAGMYMKSMTFIADEGRGECSMPGAPQVCLSGYLLG